MPDYAALYADRDTMSNHWWWRPGWHVGTRFYAWHITQDDQPAVADLAHRYRDAVSTIDTLDPIPDRWLHMTLQGVGHLGEICATTLDDVGDAVANRLRRLTPITTNYRRAHIAGEALILPPSDPEAFTELRQAIRAGITDVLGTCPEPADAFRAHVSVAYSNTKADAVPIRAALDHAEPTAATTATYTRVSLIRVHRDRRMYEWDTISTVRLDHRDQAV